MSQLKRDRIPRLQPDHKGRLQKFHRWLEENAVNGISSNATDSSRPFITSQSLKTYLEGPRELQRILDQLFSEDDETPVEPDAVLNGYTRVFAILIDIGKGRFIEEFVKHDSLSDQKLPFEVAPPRFPRDADDSEFFTKFHEHQWKFCPYIFVRNKIDAELNKRYILPIVSIERIAEGGSSTVYKITLHPEYDTLVTDTEQDSQAYPHTYVLKIYTDDDADVYYDNEVNAFRRLASTGATDNSMITFYGSFVQSGIRNVLLEYADGGTLEDFFQTVRSPVKPTDLVKFYTALFKILQAISRIHDMDPHEHGGRKSFQGWHQDIKPTNILVKNSRTGSTYDCEFKLADLGLSHFKRRRAMTGDTMGRDAGGTREYGAPDCYRMDEFMQRNRLDVKQTVDCWSIACIYSEAAVWAVQHKEGLEEYRNARRAQTRLIQDFKDEGCFHDGEKVISAVRQRHDVVLDDTRKNDHVTQLILEMVDQTLVHSSIRPNAKFLWGRSRSILQAAEQKAGNDRQHNYRSYSDDQSRALEGCGYALPNSGRPTSPDEQVPRRFGSMREPRSERTSNERTPDLVADTGDVQSIDTLNINSPQPKSPPLQFRGGQAPIGRQSKIVNDDQDAFGGPSRYSGNTNVRSPTYSGLGLPPDLKPANRSDDWRTGQFDPNPVSSQRTKNVTTYGPYGLSDAIESDAQLAARLQAEEDAQALQSSAGRGRGAAELVFSDRGLTFPEGPQRPDAVYSTVPTRVGTQNRTQTFAQSVRGSTFKAVPKLSIGEAHTWMQAKQSNRTLLSNTARRAAHLPNEMLLTVLNQRDHVFLVDDSSSMNQHWQEVISVFHILAYMLKGSDPDGLDLWFTIATEKVHSKHTTALVQSLVNKRPEGYTDIGLRLGSILQDYQSQLHNEATSRSRSWALTQRSRPVKPMNIYVFTDAEWQPGSDAATPITSMVHKLDALGYKKDQVGIQFISFGDDPERLDKLRQLDSRMALTRDIVDTEPSNGNVWKMLLGPINDWFDGDQPSAPPPGYSNGYGT